MLHLLTYSQVMLDLARIIFEEQSTIEQMVYRIMTHTQSLLQCERVQVSVHPCDFFMDQRNN